MEYNNPDIINSPETIEVSTNSLILYNDSVNSFLDVILALREVLGWTMEACENAATIAHNKGKYRLKSGSYLDLEPLKYKLEERNLTVEIQ